MKEIVEAILAVDNKHVQFIILFGSQAQGTQKKYSDTDITIGYDGPVEHSFLIDVAAHLPNNVDVSLFHQLPLVIRDQASRGRILYARDREETIQQLQFVRKEFFRFKRHYEEHVKARRERLYAQNEN